MLKNFLNVKYYHFNLKSELSKLYKNPTDLQTRFLILGKHQGHPVIVQIDVGKRKITIYA